MLVKDLRCAGKSVVTDAVVILHEQGRPHRAKDLLDQELSAFYSEDPEAN